MAVSVILHFDSAEAIAWQLFFFFFPGYLLNLKLVLQRTFYFIYSFDGLVELRQHKTNSRVPAEVASPVAAGAAAQRPPVTRAQWSCLLLFSDAQRRQAPTPLWSHLLLSAADAQTMLAGVSVYP